MMDEDLRAKALEMAVEMMKVRANNKHDLIEQAEEIYQWLRYGKDGATETRMALDGRIDFSGITLTDPSTGETRPGRVVGRDNDILDRIRRNDGYRKD